MTFLVELTARARRDLLLLVEKKNVAGSQPGARWFNGLQAAVQSLSENPQRCPEALDCQPSPRSVRHLLYGRKPHVDRILFAIDNKNHRVVILTIRHAARNTTPPTTP